MTGSIEQGGVYVYQSNIPRGVRGFRYRVVNKDVLHVPSYSRLVLVEALDGPDAGLMFVCSSSNFERRYLKEQQ